MADHILQTERLYLEKFTPEHAPFVLELLNSPGWLEFIGDRGIRTLEDARRYILNGPMTAYAQYGDGFSAVCLRSNGRPIGGCGLIRREGLDYPDIGFAFLPEFAGQGYAYEIAVATLAYAREELGITRILAIVQPENTRSIRLLEKIGMEYAGMVRLPGEVVDLMLFEVDLG